MQKPGGLKKPLQPGSLRKAHLPVCPCWDCTMARAERAMTPKLPKVTDEQVAAYKKREGR